MMYHYVAVIFLLVILFLLRCFFILFPSIFIVFNYVPELVKLFLLTMGTLEMATIAFPWTTRQEVHCFFKKITRCFWALTTNIKNPETIIFQVLKV